MTFPVAFLQMADPYAWVLRGLMELGWEDISLSPEAYPRIKGRGIDYSRLIDPTNHVGLRLVSLALDADEEWYKTDGAYQFEVRLVNDPRKSFCLLLRSDEMAMSKLFSWNSERPNYVVEDLHRAIVQATIQFIEKRKRRESISSIDLQEMLNHPIIPPPAHFVSIMSQRLYQGLNLNTAPQEGLWQGSPPLIVQPTSPVHPTAPPLPAMSESAKSVEAIPSHQPIEVSPDVPQHQFSISAGMGRGQLMAETGLASQALSSAMVIIEPAAKYLLWVSYVGMLLGVLATVNGLFTLFMMSTGAAVRGSKDGLYLVVVILSVGLGILGIVGGFLSQKYNSDFKTLSPNSTRHFPLLFALLYPLTWFIGLPVGLYAVNLLRKPEVQSAKEGL